MDRLLALFSRKFLVAVGSFVTLVTAKRYYEALGVAVAYIGVETHLDTKAIAAQARDAVDHADDAIQDAHV